MSTALRRSSSSPDPWFPNRQPNPRARARLFCFPYAGGSASAFNGWSAALPPTIELCAVQLPGRERRLMEPPFRQLHEMLDALEPALAPLLDKPFAFFGYSMGTRIALALTQRWQIRGAPLPRGIVLAAAGAPHAREDKRLHELDNDKFIEELRRYDGTPAELFTHRELLELLLPTLRADFAIAYSPYHGGEPLRCPLSVWGGVEDKHVTEESQLRWKDLTTSDCHFRRFPGGHFFLRSDRESVLTALREDLTRWFPESLT